MNGYSLFGLAFLALAMAGFAPAVRRLTERLLPYRLHLQWNGLAGFRCWIERIEG